MQAAEMNELRLIKNKKKHDDRQKRSMKTVIVVSEEAQFSWYGHVGHMDDSRIPKMITQLESDQQEVSGASQEKMDPEHNRGGRSTRGHYYRYRRV